MKLHAASYSQLSYWIGLLIIVMGVLVPIFLPLVNQRAKKGLYGQRSSRRD